MGPFTSDPPIWQVKKAMGPFILRRLKRDVLQDLPKKTETVRLVKMPQQQKAVYQSTIQLLAEQAKAKM